MHRSGNDRCIHVHVHGGHGGSLLSVSLLMSRFANLASIHLERFLQTEDKIMAPLVEYAGSSEEEDEDQQQQHQTKSKSKSISISSSASIPMSINPAPKVENSLLFTNGITSNSTKEIARNLPLNQLEKPIQGSLRGVRRVRRVEYWLN